jgi:type II secretory pathway pseudopilin PulG
VKSGSTLVEVMASILILAIIAIAGAAYLAQANSTIAVQRNRMSAVAVASRCLEEWRGTGWGSVTNLLPNPRSGVTVNVRRTGLCSWAGGSTNVTLNGVVMPVTNAICYVDADGGSASWDAVQVTVSVTYPGRAGSSVVLQTILGSY